MIPRIIRPSSLRATSQRCSIGLQPYHRNHSHRRLAPTALCIATWQSSRGFTSSAPRLQDLRGQPLEAPNAPETQLPGVGAGRAGVGAEAAASPPGATAAAEQPPRPRRRRGRRLLFAAAFLALGVALGTPVRFFLGPPPLPEPGSVAEAHALAHVRARGEALPLVRALAADPAWTSWHAYGGVPASDPASPSPPPDASAPLPPSTSASAKATAKPRPDRLTTGPLGTSSGVGGYQRIFHKAATGEVVSVIFLGGGTSGWPGVVHGGALATLLDESLGRCALRSVPSGTGVTARLELRYAAPTAAGRFHVIRCAPVPEAELDERDRGKRDRKVWCRATLETLEGVVCVEASGLFVMPRGIELQRLGEHF